MAKRNVNYIKPEDPEFLKILKAQAGYDDRNHKFDELENAEDDFVVDTDTENPQVVVLKPGDLTAEEAEAEKIKIEKEQLEAKADLTQKIIFKAKVKSTENNTNGKKRKKDDKSILDSKKTKTLLSFDDEEEED